MYDGLVVALVMLNIELGHEEDICTMDLREYLFATPSTSSTATIVTNNIYRIKRAM